MGCNAVVQRRAALFVGTHQANASADPGAVVVKLLHTVVTHGAMRAAGRPPMIARGAPLGLDHKAIDLMLLEPWPRPAATPPCLCCS